MPSVPKRTPQSTAANVRKAVPASPRPPPPTGGDAPPRLPVWTWVALFATLVLLLGHAHIYAFLTDDAHISFRYSRNLAHGFGLVFNPGREAVEGYTNFLWVLTLALCARLGIPPEDAANPLSLVATVLLWAVVVAFALRRRPLAANAWLLPFPPLALALTRSVAVWSTSGLETRLFEVLVVSGVLRLVVELEDREAGRATRSISPWLFAFGAWTRPDGLLIAGCAGAAGLVYLTRRAKATLRPYVLGWAPFVGLVGAQFAFRRLYFGDWLPNTFYAKVSGSARWAWGGRYFEALSLEYFAFLWVPALVAGVVAGIRRGTPAFALLVGCVVLPHAFYVTAIGGDHFEYRPADVYFPLVFLLLYDGLAALATNRRARIATAAYAALMLFGLTLIPWASHREYPASYAAGFPGLGLEHEREARDFLSPDRDPLLRLPGLRAVATAHRDLTRWLTLRFIAVRQEEHRLFLASVVPEGRALHRLVERGVLPEDTRIAVDCAGAIPYYSDLETLDRLGLTDSHIAHSAPVRDLLAHGKFATMDYARERRVDLWAADPVHLLYEPTSTELLGRLQAGIERGLPYFAADVGDEGILLCKLPQGPEDLARRFPRLGLRAVRDSSFEHAFLTRAVHLLDAALQRDPHDFDSALKYGVILMLGGQWDQARDLYEMLSRSRPDLREPLESLATCQRALGHEPEARAAARRALEIAVAEGDTASAERIRGTFGL